MDKEQAINIILANACCDLGNACELCPYGGRKEASKECKALKPDNVLLRQAIAVLNKKGFQHLEISKIVTISTAHIRPQTAQWIDYENNNLIFYNKDEYGWFFHINKNMLNDKNIPEDLMNVFKFVCDIGYEWLCLDSDGLIVEELKTYEWDK